MAGQFVLGILQSITTAFSWSRSAPMLLVACGVKKLKYLYWKDMRSNGREPAGRVGGRSTAC